MWCIVEMLLKATKMEQKYYLFAGIMLGRMGSSGVPLVSFCQCLNESVMKIVAVSVW